MDPLSNSAYTTHPPADHGTHVILINKWGRPDVLEEREVRLPAPSPGEVHLNVEAAGVNFADLIMRIDRYT